MTVPITFRGSGTWGSGKGAPLSIGELDGNFYELKTAVESLQDSVPDAGEGIDHVEVDVAAATVSVHGTAGTVWGPIPWPRALLTGADTWASGTTYPLRALVTAPESAGGIGAGATCVCVAEHTAGAWADDVASGYWQQVAPAPLVATSRTVTPPYTVTVADGHKLLRADSDGAITLPPVGDVPDGWVVAIGGQAGVSGTIQDDTGADLTHYSDTAVVLYSTGSAWVPVGGGGGGWTVYDEAPNDTVPVYALETGADGDATVALVPFGAGAITAQVPDGTATGGNTRGAGAVDWQRSRASATQVASGDQALIAGGTHNSAEGEASWVPGGVGARAYLYGHGAWSSAYHGTPGDAQANRFTHLRMTADGTPTPLTADGGAPAGGNIGYIPDGTTALVRAHVVARSEGGDVQGWHVEALVTRDVGADTTRIVGEPKITAWTTGVPWTVSVLADTSIGAFMFIVTGAAGTTIRWLADIAAATVGYHGGVT